MSRPAQAALATLWAVVLVAAYIALPLVLGWSQPGWWYGFGWVAVVVLWAMPVAIVAADSADS